MYSVVLMLHSIVRWILLVLVLAAMIKALAGWLGRKPWNRADNALGAAYTGLMDFQVLLGVILYFVLSPITTAGLRNFAGAMSNASARFFLVEHLLGMVIAAALAHVGRSMARNSGDDVRKHRLVFIFFTASLVALLAAIPWSRFF